MNDNRNFRQTPTQNRAPRPAPRPVSVPKKRKRRAGLIPLILILFVLLTIVLCALFLLRCKPKPDQNVPFSTEPQSTDGEDRPTVSPGDTTYTRKDGVYNFLLAGMDHVGLNTDVMIVANYDVNAQKLSLIQFPRDTFFDEQKLNSRFQTHYLDKWSEDKDERKSFGINGLKEDIEKTFCIKIDYTAVMDLSGFEKTVDAIGGVDMTVPFDMDYEDPVQDLYIHISKGYQNLNGKKAMQFIRFRNSYLEGDLGRTDAAKLFLSAFIKSFKASINIKNISSVVSVVKDSLVIDISLSDLLYFAKNAIDLDLSSVSFMTLPGCDTREYKDSGRWFYIVKKNDAVKAVNTYLNVYDDDITTAIFDPSKNLYDPSKDGFAEIYDSPAGDLSVYTASEIDQDGITIYRK
ncbi:MAG: LCP family protein [Clostridia bacterium]|nr:LCP family protein [Clostridia bacterium]